MLYLDIAPCHGQLFFKSADLDVGAGDLAGERYQGVVVRSDLRAQAGTGGFHPATVAPPEIQFPGGVQTGIRSPVTGVGGRVEVRYVLAEVLARSRSGGLLDLWVL